MSWYGDIAPSAILDIKFCTVNTSGAPTALGGTPAISVYKDNSTTQSTSGVTLTVDFDGVTGLNNVRIDTSADGTFYAAASNFQVVITTGTVGGTSVVGYVVGSFSINHRPITTPQANAITAASINPAAITAAKFGAGAIDATAVADGAIDANTFAAGAINAAAIASDAITAAKIATGAITSAKFAAGAIDAAAVATDAFGALELASDAANEIGVAVNAAANNGTVVRQNTAQAGGAGTITLDASASATDDIYVGLQVDLISATGAGQARRITDYNGTTKVATVDWNWITNPDATTGFVIRAIAGPKVDSSMQVVSASVQGNVTGSIGSLGATAKTDVNAEVVDVLETDTHAELASLPGDNPTKIQMIQLIFEAVKHKLTTTSTQQKLHKADSVSILSTSSVSDDGTTATRSKMS